MVLSALAVARAEGCDWDSSAMLANVVGGLEVERFGVVPITRREVHDELRHLVGLRGAKVLHRASLVEEIRRRRAAGDVVVFTNGCFDLLHMGHVRYLQQAREIGSCLIVAINSDDSVRRLKGPGRPIIGQDERAEMLGSLECVDYVTMFDEDTPTELLELLRPDVLAKGGSTPHVVGRELVEAYGGRVLTLELVEGLSTTKIIERIMDAGGDRPARQDGHRAGESSK
jgi:D-beta-D-heptose 7-phosphate kinase/D-beta-D-heptose 1-phosphate adenosyltransferase